MDRYGRPRPYQLPSSAPARAPFSVDSDTLDDCCGGCWLCADTARLHTLSDHAAEDPLLFGNAAAGVDDAEAELVDQMVVFLEHARLEQAEALVEIRAEPHVHAGLVELQRDAARH